MCRKEPSRISVPPQRRIRRRDAAALGGGPLPSWRTGLIIGWAGTRGIVTVATALALPQAFPERGMLLFGAFSVTLGIAARLPLNARTIHAGSL